MNKYAAAGLLNAAITGSSIIVLAHAQAAVRDVMDEFRRIAPSGPGVSITVKNGEERFDFAAAGSISVRGWRRSLRGCTADVLYLDVGVDEQIRDLDVFSEMREVIATSTLGEIVRP